MQRRHYRQCQVAHRDWKPLSEVKKAGTRHVYVRYRSPDMFHDVASLAPGSDDYSYGNRPPGHVEHPEQEQTRILRPLDNSDNVEKIKGQRGRCKIPDHLEADAGDDYVQRCYVAMIEERPAGSDRVKTMARDMAEHEQWQVSAPHKRQKRDALINPMVQERPHPQHRQGEDERF